MGYDIHDCKRMVIFQFAKISHYQRVAFFPLLWLVFHRSNG